MGVCHMFDIRYLYEKIRILKKQQRKFWSNCFFLDNRLQTLSKMPGTSLHIGLHNLFLIVEEPLFHRLYYWSDGKDILADITAMSQIQKKQTLIELIGYETEISWLRENLIQHGFQLYATMERMQASHVECCELKIEGVSFGKAMPEDLPDIMYLLRDSLDPYTAHLPSIEYLRYLQEQSLIYGAYAGGNLAGAACLENIGSQGKYNYQIAVRPTCQHRGIGLGLTKYYMSQYPRCSRWTTWVEKKNMASQKMQEQAGYQKDGLKTAVMLWEKR